MENNEIEILEETNKKKGSKRPYVVAIVLALALVVTITATSYAYFSANVSGTSRETVVTTTSLEIEFTDGAAVSLQNALPGQYVEKTFKVENKGNGDTTYDVYMSDLINDFADKTDLVYTLTSNDGGYNVSTNTQVPASSSKIVNAQLLRAGETHNYTLRISFLETNDNQDDNKGKSFSTIIRVNEVQEAVLPTAVETITALADNEELEYDQTDDNNLRYIGANPNNYVEFNNELWRIIGVMNNVQIGSGETQSLLKIIRADTLGSGDYLWDITDYSVNSGFGTNEWSQSILMKELNYDYLGNVQIGTDGKWYGNDSMENMKNADMPENILSTESQNKIEDVVWKLGSPNNNNGTALSGDDSLLIAPYIYSKERSDLSGKVCDPTTTDGKLYCNDTVTRTTSWTGKVGLFYISDLLYATSGGNGISRETCLNTKIISWHDCALNSWVYTLNWMEWTMSPAADNYQSTYVFKNEAWGAISKSIASKANLGIRPVVFLKSDISITGGEGSSTNPYTLR